MSDTIENREGSPTQGTVEALEPIEPIEPIEPATPIDSRFLFVDVAAQRANQLRRGARIRLNTEDGRHLPHKLERVAMEEVRHRLVQYSVPDTPDSRAAAD
jgi:DNA-directed RNA polymerase subunit K/omega